MGHNINFPFSMLKELVYQLPDELKKELIAELSKSLSETDDEENDEPINIEDYMPNYALEGWNEPIDLEKHKINWEAGKELIDLWKDELSAEELCAMLTK